MAQVSNPSNRRAGGSSRQFGKAEFGIDGVTTMMTTNRALRAREVSRPTEQQLREAADVLPQLLSRVRGRR